MARPIVSVYSSHLAERYFLCPHLPYVACARAVRFRMKASRLLNAFCDCKSNRLSLVVMQCVVYALVLLCSFFALSESVPQTVNVRLCMGEVFSFKQGSENSTAFTRAYTTVPQVQDLAKANFGVIPTATFNVTFNPTTQSINFGAIAIKNLTGTLTAVHIHGPCLPSSTGAVAANPCDAPVVYTICSGLSTTCPFDTIPAFTVDVSQQNQGLSTVVGLYQGIMNENKLYYVNFHTDV